MTRRVQSGKQSHRAVPPAESTEPAHPAAPELPAPTTVREVPDLNAPLFRRRLMAWYRAHARTLPWRETADPYRIWVSEIMLQQTRVAAVIEHYIEFLRRFPTLVALSLAAESDVLAAWSGLGYYRRARMLHKAAQFIVQERAGILPDTAADLRTLPGIGDYTAAAIASIAFGESVAVVDGNVERVILRLTGRSAEDSPARGAEMRAFIRTQAQGLMPPRRIIEAAAIHSASGTRSALAGTWDSTERIALAAAAYPEEPAGHSRPPTEDATTTDPSASRISRTNAAGDHNQAMMELGATICLPRAPLCLQCPVYALCGTRGEHPTAARAPQLSRPVAYLLDLRKRGTATEVLLVRRPADASLMPSMYELPTLPLDAVEGREPALRLRHAITGTNYYVQIFAASVRISEKSSRDDAEMLRRALPTRSRDLHWMRTSVLTALPLTGLARKVLHRLKIMEGPDIALLK